MEQDKDGRNAAILPAAAAPVSDLDLQGDLHADKLKYFHLLERGGFENQEQEA